MRGKTVAIAALTTLALAGGYAAADAFDVVPGFLTTRPGVVEPVPYPQLDGVPAERRGARFVCALAYVAPDGERHLWRGVMPGSACRGSAGEQRLRLRPDLRPRWL